MSDRSVPRPAGVQELSYPGQPKCRYCGIGLDRLRAGLGWCGGTTCSVRHRNEVVHAVYKQKWDDHVEQLEREVDRHGPEILAGARMLGRDIGDLPIGLVPRQTRPMARLPDDRRRAFVDHVRSVVEASFQEEEKPKERSGRVATEDAEPDKTSSACAICQGHCCILGGAANAFLTSQTIDHVRCANPDLTATEIIETYENAVPDESVEDSCIYHGPMGCVNDRAWRADVCNTFQCHGKRRATDHMYETGRDTVLWIGVEKVGTGSAVAAFDPEGGFRRVHPDADQGDTDPDRIATALATVYERLPKRLPDLAKPVVAPPGQACRWCGAPIDINRARLSGSCGSASCEHARAGRRPEG